MPISPTDVAGCKIWVKADQITASDNDPIATWSDQSGNSNDFTQAVAGLKPLYKENILNSLPAVRFDGSDDGMLGLYTVLNPYTIFLVENTLSSASDLRTIQSNVTNSLISGGRDSNNTCFAGTNISNFKASVGGNILVLRGKAAGALYFVNGTDRTNTTGNTANWGLLTLGATGLVAEPAATDICELIVYDSDIGDTNYNDVGFYLQEKYAVASGYTGSTAKPYYYHRNQ